MTEAEREEDQEKYDKIFKIRERKFNNLLRIQSDLVYYGHFTLTDIDKMKVIERRFHINEINRRLEEINKAKKANANQGKSTKPKKARRHKR